MEIFLIIAGCFSLIGAIANWNWFFNAYKSSKLVELIGRNGARIFYGVVGVFLIILGIVMFVD